MWVCRKLLTLTGDSVFSMERAQCSPLCCLCWCKAFPGCSGTGSHPSCTGAKRPTKANILVREWLMHYTGFVCKPFSFMYFVPGRCQAEQLCLISKLPGVSQVPQHELQWSQNQNQKELFAPSAARRVFSLLLLCSFLHIWNRKCATYCGIGGLLARCWFMRANANIFHLFLVAELQRKPHLPPLLLIPWEALFVNTAQAGFELVPHPRKREKNNPKQLQSFHLRN